ncbi:hypothetical protein SAMN02745220_00207 [Desulfopila aestuarii DSM 18488]|uniref:Uncharacterized protein n=1 Tax=Desulfopila aestuarii DSM 18488 TaxID=1121416 RepID=A0A1M7XW10_9BACT|nr:hypothetical protein SAMN02745220_00207 [Desulfopila aestuarii DSM 18488]
MYMPVVKFLACLGVYAYLILSKNPHFAKGSVGNVSDEGVIGSGYTTQISGTRNNPPIHLLTTWLLIGLLRCSFSTVYGI